MPEEKTIVSLATATAGEVIAELGMQPHPEGGHFVEIFRDRPSTGERGAVTSIYFLLRSGEVSRNDQAEYRPRRDFATIAGLTSRKPPSVVYILPGCGIGS